MIALEILASHQALAIEENLAKGEILATIEDPDPLLSPEPVNIIVGIWITQKHRGGSSITVICRYSYLKLWRNLPTPTTFHAAFQKGLRSHCLPGRFRINTLTGATPN